MTHDIVSFGYIKKRLIQIRSALWTNLIGLYTTEPTKTNYTTDKFTPYPGQYFPFYLLRVPHSHPNKLYFQFAALSLGRLFQIYPDSIHWSQQKRIQTVPLLYNTASIKKKKTTTNKKTKSTDVQDIIFIWKKIELRFDIFTGFFKEVFTWVLKYSRCIGLKLAPLRSKWLAPAR